MSPRGARRRPRGGRALPFAAAVALALVAAAPSAAAPAWLPATGLADGAGGDAPEVSVAVAPDGTAVAAWSRPGDGGPVVEAARRRPGQGWSAPVPLTPEGEHGRAPQAGIDARDDAIVTWLDPGAGAVRAARLPAAADAFEAAQTLTTGGRAGEPAIGVGADGTAIAVFAEGPDGARVIRAAVRAPGAEAFAEPTTVSGSFRSFASRTGREPAAVLAVGPAGGAVVAWAGFDGRRHLVQASVRDPGGDFAGAQTRSSTAAAASGTEPAVALDPAGRATLAWTHDADAGDAANPTQVRWSERAPDGDFGADEAVADADAPPTASPSLAATADGTVIGAWVAGSGDERAVQAAVRTPGAPFAGHRTLSAPGGVVVPVVRADGAGHALVAWAAPGADAILSVRRTLAGAFGNVQTAAAVAPEAPAELSAPALGLDDEGNGTAVWSRRTGADAAAVQAAGYDAAPPVLVAARAGGRGVATVPMAMRASAVDRWSAVSYAWSFGDDRFAGGAAVRHTYRRAGRYDVALTASDAVGNATVTTARAVIRAPRRTALPVSARWRPAARSRRVVLTRLRVLRAPRRTVAVLRCAGARCPVEREVARRTGRRRGAIDVAGALGAARNRRFRAGQTVTLTVTAPRRSGLVVRYRLRRGRPPLEQTLCLPPGARTPRPRCG